VDGMQKIFMISILKISNENIIKKMIKQFITQNITSREWVNFKINFQGNILAVKYGTKLEFYVGSMTNPYKIKQWIKTLTTNTIILPS
jgi:hypothetical protein